MPKVLRRILRTGPCGRPKSQRGPFVTESRLPAGRLLVVELHPTYLTLRVKNGRGGWDLPYDAALAAAIVHTDGRPRHDGAAATTAPTAGATEGP